MAKPCPFCGCNNSHAGVNGEGDAYRRCRECHAVGPMVPVLDSESGAMRRATEAWNRRAPKEK